MNCFNCNEPVSEEFRCHGCDAYICEDCDVSEIMGHNHQPSDHLDPDEFEE